ncbi:CatA-like O-acetyltransferase [Amycolatopsis antarctica]|uniref:CatA-like O-acetyltransferase n=1 Tax=Amycolatopsis antarctica TaxID=1854586 RepID=UPI00196B73EA|nr:CatA-like O-acetyltransferase [Amycolatopsis antarctica]
MCTPRPIDTSTWARHAHFEHYRNRRPTYYAITVELDVTALVARLRATGRKTYPAQIWALATVVNRHEEFRMTVDEQGRPAIWDVVDPSFTVFNPGRETFANVRAPFDPDFTSFHPAAAALIAEHRHATTPFPQGFPPPSNLFDISSMPWTSFTGFTLHVESGWDHFAPAFTLGRYLERGDRTVMPLALQIHHSAADGFHTARLLNELQELVGSPDWLT